jgi:hypothetical protein
MTKTTMWTATGNLVKSIQIAGGNNVFEGNRWREAILFYLNGVWANDTAVMYRPKISFADTTLRLEGDHYYAYAVNGCNLGDRPYVADEDMLIVLDPTQGEVESGLIRFVKNSQVRQLAVVFPEKGHLVLTKGLKRSELFVTAVNLQLMEEAIRDRGYKV